MDRFATSHFSHDALIHDLKTIDGGDRMTTAVLLSRVGEVDERRLYLREGHPSMHAYCVEELHWCEGTASRRIYAAHAARRFPLLYVAIADGRLHLTAVVMLAKHLTSGNVDDLVAAATHKSRAAIERLIAERFPRPDVPEILRPIPAPPIAPLVGATTTTNGPPGEPDSAGCARAPLPPVPSPGQEDVMGSSPAKIVRPRRAGRPRRHVHRLERAPGVPRTQPARRWARVRDRVHGTQAHGGALRAIALVACPRRSRA